MSNLQIALLGVFVVLLLAWLLLRGRAAPRRPVKRDTDRIDTVIGWPPQATRVLGKADLAALAILVRSVPEYLVLAQVPLSRFISVPKRNSYADWLRRVGYQSIDFLVCDPTGHVVAVVELQPPQPSDRARKRHDRIARTLKAAGIALHVWRENGLPPVEVVRAALIPSAAGTPPPPVNAPLPTVATAPAAGEFADTDRAQVASEEAADLLAPPPSTWFDDLDSDPVPLSKR